MEINFDKRHGGGRPKGVEAAGKGAGKEPVFCWSFQSDFTNEMDIWYLTDRVGSKRHPCRKLPEIAIHGNSPCIFDHFISGITDCTQQQKTGSQSVPLPVAATLFGLPPPWRLSKLISAS